MEEVDESQSETYVVYATIERCYNGGHVLVRVEPPLYGWVHYCADCVSMVMTETEFERSRRQPMEPGVLGHVVGLPLREPLHWTSRGA